MTNPYESIIQTMKDNGVYRLYAARAEVSDPQRILTLWAQIVAKQKEFPSGATNCFINFKVPKGSELWMHEIAELTDLALKVYTGDIIWEYEKINSDDFVLELIG